MTQRLGKGSFGDIFQGVLAPLNTPVAVKLEPLASKTP